MTTETVVNIDASTLPVMKVEQKPKSPRGGRNGDWEELDEAALETSDIICFIINAIQGGVMVAVGYSYTWEQHNGGTVDGVSTEEDNLCPNGAAHWLWLAGILLLVSNSIDGLVKIYKKRAERDGEIDCGEMAVNIFFSVVIFILDWAILIWGWAVVFEAWANWTDDFNVYKANPELLNFCEHIPMMTAFIILLLNWALIYLMIAINCLYDCYSCYSCCCRVFGASRPNRVKSL